MVTGFKVILIRKIILEQPPFFLISCTLKKFQLIESAESIIFSSNPFLKGFCDTAGFIPEKSIGEQ